MAAVCVEEKKILVACHNVDSIKKKIEDRSIIARTQIGPDVPYNFYCHFFPSSLHSPSSLYSFHSIAQHIVIVIVSSSSDDDGFPFAPIQ